MQNDPIADHAKKYRRIGQVEEILGKYPTLAAKALEENWDDGRMTAEASLQAMRDERPRTPDIHIAGGDGATATGDVLGAGLAMSCGWDNVVVQYPDEAVGSAEKLRGEFGLQRIMLEEAWANGLERSTLKITRGNCERILRLCWRNAEARMIGGPQAAAGFSSLGTTGILSNNAGKRLKERFEMLDRAYTIISDTGVATDFKQITRYRLLGHMEYMPLGKGGEIEHGRLGEESHTEKVDTKARMFALTRQDIINDDLGAFNDITNAMAQGAFFAINTEFWTAFLNNATFFTEARGNLSPQPKALDSGSLTEAVKAFREMKLPGAEGDTNYHPLGLMPRLLLVPPALEGIARELYVSRNIVVGGGDTTDDPRRPDANIHYDLYRPVSVAYLGSVSGMTGASDTAWYLLAEPMQLATMRVVYLNGVQTPIVESADADFNTLGVQMRGYFDFDATKTEPLAGYKNAGA